MKCTLKEDRIDETESNEGQVKRKNHPQTDEFEGHKKEKAKVSKEEERRERHHKGQDLEESGSQEKKTDKHSGIRFINLTSPKI